MKNKFLRTVVWEVQYLTPPQQCDTAKNAEDKKSLSVPDSLGLMHRENTWTSGLFINVSAEKPHGI